MEECYLLSRPLDLPIIREFPDKIGHVGFECRGKVYDYTINEGILFGNGVIRELSREEFSEGMLVSELPWELDDFVVDGLIHDINERKSSPQRYDFLENNCYHFLSDIIFGSKDSVDILYENIHGGTEERNFCIIEDADFSSIIASQFFCNSLEKIHEMRKSVSRFNDLVVNKINRFVEYIGDNCGLDDFLEFIDDSTRDFEDWIHPLPKPTVTPKSRLMDEPEIYYPNVDEPATPSMCISYDEYHDLCLNAHRGVCDHDPHKPDECPYNN